MDSDTWNLGCCGVSVIPGGVMCKQCVSRWEMERSRLPEQGPEGNGKVTGKRWHGFCFKPLPH